MQVSEQCCPSPEAVPWAGQEAAGTPLAQTDPGRQDLKGEHQPKQLSSYFNFMNDGIFFFFYSELIFLFLVSFFRLLEKCALRIQENSLAFAEPVSSSLEKYAIRQSILFS